MGYSCRIILRASAILFLPAFFLLVPILAGLFRRWKASIGLTSRKKRVATGSAARHYSYMTNLVSPLDERVVAYERMANALSYLGDTWQEWPDLSTAAKAVGLSPSHFQREFTRWAGISPKQYQSALAHAAAGDLLREASVLDATLEAGLSGPGRLHDLFIAHEGLSPGEAKAGGKGADLVLGRAPTPFGEGAWLMSSRGLVALGFVDENAPERTGFEHQGRNEEQAFADLAARYPDASIRRSRLRFMVRRFAARSGGPCWKFLSVRCQPMGPWRRPAAIRRRPALSVRQWAQIRSVGSFPVTVPLRRTAGSIIIIGVWRASVPC